MKKQKKQFFILMICLAVLIMGYFALQKYNEKQASLPVEDVAEPIMQVLSEEITEFSYVYEGETYSFVMEEETWKNKEDTSLNIDQTLIGNMVSRIGQMTAETTIENVTDLSLYGLDAPERTISFVTTEVSSQIQIGNYNSMQDVYYLRIDENTTVYAVTSSQLKSFKYTLEDLIVEEEEVTEETVQEEIIEVTE